MPRAARRPPHTGTITHYSDRNAYLVRMPTWIKGRPSLASGEKKRGHNRFTTREDAEAALRHHLGITVEHLEKGTITMFTLQGCELKDKKGKVLFEYDASDFFDRFDQARLFPSEESAFLALRELTERKEDVKASFTKLSSRKRVRSHSLASMPFTTAPHPGTVISALEGVTPIKKRPRLDSFSSHFSSIMSKVDDFQRTTPWFHTGPRTMYRSNSAPEPTIDTSLVNFVDCAAVSASSSTFTSTSALVVPTPSSAPLEQQEIMQSGISPKDLAEADDNSSQPPTISVLPSDPSITTEAKNRSQPSHDDTPCRAIELSTILTPCPVNAQMTSMLNMLEENIPLWTQETPVSEV